jgi:hypothetical protein
MSAEQISGEPEPSNPEQQEWQGQKWEYLLLESGESGRGISPLGRMKSRGLFADGEEFDPLSKHYKNKIKNLRRKVGDDSRRETLNLFGTDGWELVAVVPNIKFDHPNKFILFLKRPLQDQE